MKKYIIIGLLALIVGTSIILADKKTQTIHVSSILADFDSNSLINDSSLIAVGVVKNITPIKEKSAVREEDDIYSIVDITVEKQLKAKQEIKENIEVKVLGGTIGRTTMVATDWPSFKIGERIIVFLKDNPDSEYLIVTGLKQGKYGISESGALGGSEEEEEIARKVFGKNISISELETELQR